MTDNRSIQASLNRKRRKEAVERKRNKKQYINAENEIKDRKTVARHKGYLILKEKKKQNVQEQTIMSHISSTPMDLQALMWQVKIIIVKHQVVMKTLKRNMWHLR
jgi:hypothetical protein